MAVVIGFVDSTYKMIHAEPDKICENPIQFTFLNKLINFDLEYKNRVSELISAHILPDHGYIQHPWNKKDPASHDIMTAILTMSRLCGLAFHKQYKNKQWHPRDVIYYGLLKGSVIAKLFTPVLSLILIFSCLRTKKTRPNIWERPALWWLRLTKQIVFEREEIKEGGFKRIIYKYKKPKNPDDPYVYWLDEMHVTDGKLLNFIRFKSGLLPKTEKICNKILIKKYGENPWSTISLIYFKYPDHPVVKSFISRSL